jgi:hypothetical protein
MNMNTMIKMNCKPLALLPNTVGYRFVGVRHDGTLAECYVQRDPRTRCHFVAGDAKYHDLKGGAPYASC